MLGSLGSYLHFLLNGPSDVGLVAIVGRRCGCMVLCSWTACKVFLGGEV